MSFYLSRYIGTGTRADPFRPAVWETGLARGSLDLRPDSTTVDGRALVRMAADASGALWDKVAETQDEVLSSLLRRRIYQFLNVPERALATRFDAIMADLLMDPPPGAWKRLRPCRGVHEIWLQGVLFWADGTPGLPRGGTITDSFTRANETPIASPWIELSGSTGDVNLASNAITKSGTGDFFLYHNNSSGGWNADQSAKLLYVTATGSHDWGPSVRIGSNGFSGYWFGQNGNPRRLHKFVAGTWTGLEDGATACPGTGHTFKIDIAGSTIRYYTDDTEDANSPGTDTSLDTAGLGAGVFWYDTGGSLDDAVLTGEIPLWVPQQDAPEKLILVQAAQAWR